MPARCVAVGRGRGGGGCGEVRGCRCSCRQGTQSWIPTRCVARGEVVEVGLWGGQGLQVQLPLEDSQLDARG